MAGKLLMLSLTVLLCSAASVYANEEANFLEIVINQRVADSGGGPFEYDFLFALAKEGATTCELQSPLDNYACDDWGGVFVPSAEFLAAHSGLSFADVLARIVGGWTIIWDAGTGTMTQCDIEFGALAESDFLPMPVIVQPASGATLPAGVPIFVEWTFGVDPCTAVLDEVHVCPQGLWADCYQMADCSVTSWTIPAGLAPDSYQLEVFNPHDVRDVPAGLTISGHTWVLENTSWLSVQSVAEADISIVSAENLSFGAVKAMYH
jgi:hypothetical protein